MNLRTPAWWRIVVIVAIISMLAQMSIAKKLYQERIYEPVVLRGEVLAPFYDVPIQQIFMYAYHESTRTWRMMPFQIDEMERGEDPFKPGNEAAWQDFYFLPSNGVLDLRDELVFMIRDLGDRAPEDAWLDNEDARKFYRLEIKARDRHDPTNCAYGYLYRSATISDKVPAPYQFSFDVGSQCVATQFYAVRLSQQNGLIEDVIIKPPFGNGVDIFDTQKIRFVGIFDLGIITIPIGKKGSQAANERDNLYVYQPDDLDYYHLYYTPKPVVRLIREVRHTIRFGTFLMHETAFYVRTKFYPFSGTIAGGADLDPETLKKEFQMEEDIYVRLDLLRQSWDFNAAAIGMQFFNRNNQGVLIDGIPDSIDRKIMTPIREWTLTTGEQGSMFTFVEFNDSTWRDIQCYFYDNKLGGQGDGTFIDGGDTGDSVSYGDQGLLFQTHERDSVSLKLNFSAYFLPGNLTQSDAFQLAYWAENPVAVSSTTNLLSHVAPTEEADTLPQGIEWLSNYPNPFNGHTQLRFRLSEPSHICLKIINLKGQTVAVVARGWFEKGEHAIVWGALDERRQPLSAGVYFYKLQTRNNSITKKLLLIR
ncbi:MAG: T9SS type A sorting domain-containing protein [candidate division KSB1 bacterium]|nr:T9SS type A sorting domain-containing protein [candidate division KSB1 bacterium]MDZ7342658.1 T9SS type A sorting domain-containing protein [candidate division KSB1 bacterium]